MSATRTAVGAAVAAAPVALPDSVTDPLWEAALAEVVADEALPSLHAQPIVELTSGQVAGYEMLSRFPKRWSAPPDRWFAAADHWGVGAALQARVVAAAVAARDFLPADTFLTVNVDPHLLAHRDVLETLLRVGGRSGGRRADLSRVVVEITEHSRPTDAAAFGRALDAIRAQGGLVAVDDAGTGYAGLQQLLDVRPQLVKVDRELVAGIDSDPVKRALIEVLGDLAGRMDAWLLAEGVETRSELDVLITLGVPLGQGWLLGRPRPEPVPRIAEDLTAHIRASATRTALVDHVASLVEATTTGPAHDGASEVVLDDRARPVSVRVPSGGGWSWAPPLVVAPSASPREVARRAMARAARHRFAPAVCTDGRGEILGVVRVEALVRALTRSAGAPA